MGLLGHQFGKKMRLLIQMDWAAENSNWKIHQRSKSSCVNGYRCIICRSYWAFHKNASTYKYTSNSVNFGRRSLDGLSLKNPRCFTSYRWRPINSMSWSLICTSSKTKKYEAHSFICRRTQQWSLNGVRSTSISVSKMIRQLDISRQI